MGASPWISAKLAARAALRADPASPADDGRSALAAQHGFDRASLADREHDDRYTVFTGKRKGGGVHDLEVTLDRLIVAQPLVALGLGVDLRVGAVDAVDIGRFEHRLRVDLGGPQDRGGIGGEERVAGTTG